MVKLIEYAENFLEKKLVSLRKDVDICRCGVAQTPALLFCFSVIDLLGALYCGNASKRADTIKQFKKYMKDVMNYDDTQVKILQRQFRHKLVHLSEPEPIIEYNEELIAWKINWDHDPNRHLQIVELLSPAPYPAPFGINYQIKKEFWLSIPDFVEDICRSVKGTDGYLDRLKKDPKLQSYFKIAIMQMHAPEQIK